LTKTPLELYPIFIIFGALVGSFLNVVIYRVPRNLSVVTPRSSCVFCGYKIKWYENIPILSYILLRGKCKKCHSPIPIRYLLVEILCAFFAYFLIPSFLDFESIYLFIFLFTIASCFLAHFLIDMEHQILPDKINLVLFVVSLTYMVTKTTFTHWLIGGLVGFIIPYIVTWSFYKLRGVIGLGGGDIKLFGILGIVLGPVAIVQNLFMSCLLGSIVGIVLILTKRMSRSTALAFGPYIIIIASLQIFFPSLFRIINPFSI
jgi:leader peptidase (prepilin peptidase)/N-methyltransferase